MTSVRAAVKAVTPPIVSKAVSKLLSRSAYTRTENPADVAMAPFASDRLGSFAQYGEDLVIDAVLGCPSRGFYVDIGANDPALLSNTPRFYDRGWRGITVEPDPRLCSRLVADRPSDVNLNLGVGSCNGRLAFYRLDPDTLSTFDRTACEQSLREVCGAQLLDVSTIEVATLEAICRSHLRPDQTVDLLSIDVEGGELAVLAGNDWRIWRPTVVLIEVNRAGPLIVDFMASVDYDFVWCNGTNALFWTLARGDARAGEG